MALRRGGAGAAAGAAGAGAAGAVGVEVETGGAAGMLSVPSVPETTMFSTVAATLAAARATLAVAQPYKGTKHQFENLYNYLELRTMLFKHFNTFRGLFVLNSRHFAIIKVIILDTAIFGFFAAIKGLVAHKGCRL